MDSATVTKAAAMLWQSWRDGGRMDALPTDCRPASRVEGYEIARVLAGISEQPVIGWKIAATSEAGQRHINVDGPLAGRLLRDRVLEPGAKVPLGGNIMRVAEAEFAFSFAHDLPAKNSPYSQSEIVDAVDRVHLSIEIPDSRYHDFTAAGAPQLIADTACACWLVTAPSRHRAWRDIDFASYPVIFSRNEREAARGTGKAALGDPRIALTWLVNEAAVHAGGVKRGDLVTTGTCVVPVPIKPGDRIAVDYGVLGQLTTAIV